MKCSTRPDPTVPYPSDVHTLLARPSSTRPGPVRYRPRTGPSDSEQPVKQTGFSRRQPAATAGVLWRSAGSTSKSALENVTVYAWFCREDAMLFRTVSTSVAYITVRHLPYCTAQLGLYLEQLSVTRPISPYLAAIMYIPYRYPIPGRCMCYRCTSEI